MKVFTVGLFLFVVLYESIQCQNVPQQGNYQTHLLSDMMNDLRKAYDSKLSNVQKRLDQQEDLIRSLREHQRESRNLGGLQQARPHSSLYQNSLLNDMMNDLRTAYEAKLNHLNKRLTAQETRYNDLVKILLGSKRKRLLEGVQQTTSTSLPELKIAFYAQLTHDLTGIGNYQTIVFDGVQTNVGNGYNKVNGMFTAPVSGTYAFSWTTASANSLHMQTELVVNNKRIGMTWSDSGNHQDYAIASDTAVVSLQAGDVVWVRSNTVHHNTLHGQQMSTFAGWILFSE